MTFAHILSIASALESRFLGIHIPNTRDIPDTMNRYDIERRNDHDWTVIDRLTGEPVPHLPEKLGSRLEAQALADFRNRLAMPQQERIRSRLDTIRLAWAALTGKRVR